MRFFVETGVLDCPCRKCANCIVGTGAHFCHRHHYRKDPRRKFCGQSRTPVPTVCASMHLGFSLPLPFSRGLPPRVERARKQASLWAQKAPRSYAADCQASATPKNASKGERHPKHFLGLKLIDKTTSCKVSLSKE